MKGSTAVKLAGGAVSLKHLFSSLVGVKEIEARIASSFESEAPLLREVPRYLFELGGKRIRPLLALLVARAVSGKAPSQSLIDFGAGLELIHMATLLHDDIIDKSPLRRHKESAYRKYGIESTLLGGDFLLIRAFGMCARLDRYVIDATEAACVELTEGEILETPLYRERHDLQSSLRIARKKTAALFALAGRGAAHLAGASNSAAEHFAEFGERLGVAFQIVDDLLDVTADEATLGKQAGLDIHERKPSVVNVLWLASGSPLAQGLLLPSDGVSVVAEEEFVRGGLAELRASAVITEVKDLASREGELALEALDRAIAAGPIGDSSMVATLRGLVDKAIERAS